MWLLKVVVAMTHHFLMILLTIILTLCKKTLLIWFQKQRTNDTANELKDSQGKCAALVKSNAEIKAQHDSAIVNCQYSMATFSTGERKRRPRGDRKSQEMTMHLRQALAAMIRTDLYPRSQIHVFVEVLQADGGNYCACVNAAMLALIDAGIPIKEYVIACSASLANGDVTLVDISHLEETSGGSNLTVALMASSGQMEELKSESEYYQTMTQETSMRDCEICQRRFESQVHASVQTICDMPKPNTPSSSCMGQDTLQMKCVTCEYIFPILNSIITTQKLIIEHIEKQLCREK